MKIQNYSIDQQNNIRANQAEYGEFAPTIQWVAPEQAMMAEADRARLIGSASSPVSLAHKQTKPHLGALSMGCQICGQGRWSCLFINGKCNCRCFYCPTSQDDISVPTTNRIPFPKPEEYAAYVHTFGFKGISISGGEPLMTPDRTISYIEAVRHRMGPDLHIWLYTNGTLASPPLLQRLRAAGLNEIRFDISAVAYDLSKAKMAADIIPCVTVEIPAIPEDLDRVVRLLPEMAASGISFLNLHQLRLTPHNRSRLINRGYTFLHGNRVTVLESELAALTIIHKANESALTPAINYCAYVYKHRFQQAAALQRCALEMAKAYESVTEKGYIRTLALVGEPHAIRFQAEGLRKYSSDNSRWCLNTKSDRLLFHPSLWSMIDFTNGQLQTSYHQAVICNHISYRCTFKEIGLGAGTSRSIYIEKRPVQLNWQLTEEERVFFASRMLLQSAGAALLRSGYNEKIAEYELIRPGLEDYY